MANTARGINDILTDRRVLDWGNKLDKLEPDAAPLLTLTRKLGSEPAKNFKYISFKDSPFKRWFYIDAISIDTSDPECGVGTITLELTVGGSEACGKYINIGDLLFVPAKDHWMRVTNVATNTITADMEYAGYGEGNPPAAYDGRTYDSSDETARTAAQSDDLLGVDTSIYNATPVVGDRVLKVSNTFAHGGRSAVSKVLDLTETFNFIQKFLTSYEVDEETMLAAIKGEPELARLQGRKAIEHQKDIEYQLLLGDRDARADTNGKMIYTTAGLLHSAIATDVIATADFNEPALWSFLRKAFSDKMSKEKVMISGGQVVEAIAKWTLGRMVINDKIKAATGMVVPQYVTPFGTVDIVYHPLLDEGLEGYAWVLDMNRLKLKVMSNTKLKTGIQENDAYERKDEYWSELGLKLGLKDCHRRLVVT